MNGYAIIASNYRKLLKRGEIDRETVEKEIKIYDFLASCDADDLYRLVDSSAFNDIIAALLKMAASSAGMDEDAQGKILEQLRRMFDENQTKEIFKFL